MILHDEIYQKYVQILKEELVPAMGCTEPIALAYAAAKARDLLGHLPDAIEIKSSGSIIKNVKSVIVPNTHHLRGIPAAVCAGIIAGDSNKELEVISEVTEEEKDAIDAYLKNTAIQVDFLDSPHPFDLIMILHHENEFCKIQITEYHTNIVYLEKNGKVLFENKEVIVPPSFTDRSVLNMEDIWTFCQIADVEDFREVLECQIKYNTAIAEEGLKNPYGANIGKVLMHSNPEDVKTRAKAMAAAGSDARMNGCNLPVVINSGSGNQGMTCSLPVIEYAKTYQVSHETLLRALALSNLVAIHEKTGIGTLSAYCGAVSAATGAGAGIAYILGGDYITIIHTVSNALGIVSGIVCDGAKSSCAAKIASSIDAAILGYEMFLMGQEFKAGDGIIKNHIESTIKSVGVLGKDGMRQTNEEIINIMLG